MIHKSLINASLKSLIFYKRAISPYLSGQCNFSITCSEYAQKTISSKGIIKGLFLSIARIIFCSLYPIIKRFNLSNKRIPLKVFLFFLYYSLFVFLVPIFLLKEAGLML